MTYQSPKTDISTTNSNSNPTDENSPSSPENNTKLSIFTEINDSFNYIRAISDPINQEYELIQESKRLDIPVDSYRRLLAAYIKSEDTSTLDHKLLKPVKFMDQRLGDFVAWCEGISLYKLSILIGQATLLLATGSYFIDAPQRHQEELNNAKKLILDNANLQFNEARIDAFELLNQNCTTMVGIQAPKAYMPKLKLNKCYEFKPDFQTFFPKPIIFRYRGAKLNHANLAGADLSGANLAGADLSGANLEKANLAGANLAGANLAYANMKEVNLRRANLKDAHLVGANITYGIMSRANLESADLSEANLFGSWLLWVNLSHSQLYHANLSHSFLSRANLEGADFYRANLEYSLLSYTNLKKETNLRRAKLKGANFQNAYFSSVSQLQRAENWQATFLDPNWHQGIAKPRKLPKIGVIVPSLDSIFQSYLEGLWSVPGVEVITIHSDLTVESEAKTIQALMKEGVDAIVLRPQDPEESVAAIKKAFNEGVIPITIGDCINESASKRFIFGCFESNSVKMGYESTQALLEYMKRKYSGQFINVGLVDGTSAGRVYPYFQGFKQAMEKSGVQWREVASTDAIDEKDISKITLMLQTNPSINVIWSGSDTTTSAAVKAIQALGLGSKIKVFGIMDLTPEKVKMLQDPLNPLQSIVDQSPREAGREAAKRILRVLKRENLEYEYHLIPHKTLSNTN
jgi:uncharacterized protein YjbI with pentapeptide repeats/ABC-type sugar transport system substrate-binding protein